ncbi:MAG: phosphoenolpyruvate carboxylase [Leptotrichia hongkongensis]
MAQSVSDLLEAMVLLKEFGLIHADGDHPTGTVDVIPLFETYQNIWIRYFYLLFKLLKHSFYIHFKLLLNFIL